jgi:hypothetical protein
VAEGISGDRRRQSGLPTLRTIELNGNSSKDFFLDFKLYVKYRRRGITQKKANNISKLPLHGE